MSCVETNRESLKKNFGIVFHKYIGRGTFSKVYLGIYENKNVALKVINIKELSDISLKFVKRETSIVETLDHPSIIKTMRVINSGNKIIFVQEYCSSGDLLEKIQRQVMKEPEAKITFRQLMEALLYLNNKNLIHRDLKCENIFLDQNENIKLGDFGFSRYLSNEEEATSWCGSKPYCAPEILMRQKYKGQSSDIWSAGVVLYIMVTGLMPFTDEADLIEQQIKAKIKFSSKFNLTKQLKKLILAILHPKPNERPDCNQICASEWLKDVPYTHKVASLIKSERI